jgi:hypothetical protein
MCTFSFIRYRMTWCGRTTCTGIHWCWLIKSSRKAAADWFHLEGAGFWLDVLIRRDCSCLNLSPFLDVTGIYLVSKEQNFFKLSGAGFWVQISKPDRNPDPSILKPQLKLVKNVDFLSFTSLRNRYSAAILLGIFWVRGPRKDAGNEDWGSGLLVARIIMDSL